MPNNLKRIKATLLTAGMQRTNPALYQSLNDIIDFSQDNIDEINGRLLIIVGPSGGGGGGITGASYLTITDEHATLPNSRELLAGTNISFDDSIPHERTINSTALSVDFVVVSDGGVPTASPINDGDGSFIYTTYTP